MQRLILKKNTAAQNETAQIQIPQLTSCVILKSTGNDAISHPGSKNSGAALILDGDFPRRLCASRDVSAQNKTTSPTRGLLKKVYISDSASKSTSAPPVRDSYSVRFLTLHPGRGGGVLTERSINELRYHSDERPCPPLWYLGMTVHLFFTKSYFFRVALWDCSQNDRAGSQPVPRAFSRSRLAARPSQMGAVAVIRPGGTSVRSAREQQGEV